MKKTLAYLLMILWASGLSATEKDSSESTEYKRIEALMNITNTLSRFAGNTPRQTVFEEPFLLGLKISSKNKKSALRIGINFTYLSTNEDDLFGTSRSSHISSWAPLIGYEWRKDLGYGFEFYGGIDGRYYYDINNTTTVNFSSSGTSKTVFRNTLEGFGAGPFCGFMYNITPRICLLTEANFYVNFIKSTRKFSSDGSTFETFENKKASNVSPNAPSSLCILFKF